MAFEVLYAMGQWDLAREGHIYRRTSYSIDCLLIEKRRQIHRTWTTLLTDCPRIWKNSTTLMMVIDYIVKNILVSRGNFPLCIFIYIPRISVIIYIYRHLGQRKPNYDHQTADNCLHIRSFSANHQVSISCEFPLFIFDMLDFEHWKIIIIFDIACVRMYLYKIYIFTCLYVFWQTLICLH